MTVSVIVPVYNVERYLARCLDSILTAVREVGPSTSVEIICVNDGSTDSCAEILHYYHSTFDLRPSSFIVLTKSNGGLGSARNAGLDVMTGDYAMFIDSDDWIPAGAIAAFVAVAEASRAQLVVSTSFAKDEDRPDSGVSHEPSWRCRAREWIAGKKVQYSACNKLYSADLLRGRRFGTTLYEDFPFTTGVFCDVETFAAIAEPLYVYCTNGGASSIVRSSFSERKLESSFEVVRSVLDKAQGRGASCQAFAIRQAMDGLSSTVRQVYRSGDSALVASFGKEMKVLEDDYPCVRKGLSLKARFRLWRMGL